MKVFTEDQAFVQRVTAIFPERKVEMAAKPSSMERAAGGTDIILLDLETGFHPTAGFNGVAPLFDCPCLALSNLPHYEEAVQLIQYGIRGYGNKYMQSANLCQAVSIVEAGQIWLIPSLLNRLIRNMAPAGAGAAKEGFWGQISKREKEVADFIAQGRSNQEIADAMYVSLRTVKAHLTSIYRKTGCRDRMELALKVSRLT